MDLNYLTSYQPSDLPVQTEVSGSDTETDTGTGTVGDAGTSNVSYVNYDVSKEFCFKTINGELFAQVLDVETIVITDKFVGFVRYSPFVSTAMAANPVALEN